MIMELGSDEIQNHINSSYRNQTVSFPQLLYLPALIFPLPCTPKKERTVSELHTTLDCLFCITSKPSILFFFFF